MVKLSRNMAIAIALVIIVVIAAFVGIYWYFLMPEEEGEKITLRFFTTETAPNHITYFFKLANAFEEEHPNVVIEPEFGKALQEVDTLRAAIAAGTQPQILHIANWVSLLLANEELIIPVDDVIAAIGENDFYSAPVEQCSLGGHVYAVPNTVVSWSLVYRTDWFEEKGLSPPETLDELLAAAEALTEDTDDDGEIDRYGIVHAMRGGDGQEYYVYMVWMHGGYIFDIDKNVAYDTDVTSREAWIEALNYTKRLSQYCPPGVAEYAVSDCYTSFAKGQSAMMFVFGRVADYIERYNPEIAPYVKATPLPMKNETMDQVGAIVPKGWAISDGLSAEEEELARDFIEMSFSTEWYLDYLMAVPAHNLPPLKSVATSTAYLEDSRTVKYKSIIEVSTGLLAEDARSINKEYPDPSYFYPEAGALWGSTVFVDAVESVVWQGKAPSEAAAKAAVDLQDLMGS